MKRFKLMSALLLCVTMCAPMAVTAAAEEKTVPTAFRTGTIESDGAVIEYALYGAPDGEPAVLIPGNGSDMHGLDGKVLPYYAEHFMTITFSNRGTGNSTRGEGKLTFDVMAKDLLNLLDYLEIDKVNLFGFSDGGNLALVFTVNYPERVKTLVPMSANINPFGTKVTSQIGICTNYFWKWVKTLFNDDPELAVKRDIQGLMVWHPKLTFGDLKSISVPTLNIFGEHDMMKRSHSRRITKSIADAKELMVIGGEHGSCFEQTDTVIIPALNDFYGF